MNIAMLSGWHVHATGYANEFNAQEGVKVTAVWDEIPERGQKWAADLGATFYEDVDALLADESIDAVACSSPTNLHGDLLVRAAKAGKHIFTEKVLALTNEEAYAIRDAVRENGVRFTISFPHQTNPAIATAKKLCEQGVLGTLTYGRMRNVHSGSIRDWLPPHFYDATQCGGGAMIDLGAHPMYLLADFLGKPTRISSAFTNVTDRPVEDNAVSLLEFEGGAIGVSETGFVSLCDPFTLEISGTAGCLRVVGHELTVTTAQGSKTYSKDEMSVDFLSPISYFVQSVRDGKDGKHYGIDEAVRLTEIMVAAYAAAKTAAKADLR
ncbi:MAG: Gfo/Idh/MocA family oxidoreductase [Clostridia bacterium]|nr:Gfo/Idh/MocA family oxidoreductase [Clostridia bacterium]